jgi:N-acetylglucosamine-6-phosphate deacetylase
MQLLRGRHYDSGQVRDFELTGSVIESIGTPDAGRQPDLGGEEYWITPGLLDLQVNGWGSHLLTDPTVGPGEVAAVAELLLAAGVTGFCPTITTDSRSTIERAMRAIASACSSHPAVRGRVLGIHLEGPYISALDGPRGAHSREHVRPPDWDEFQHWQEAADGLIRLVTLAPELPGALEFITRLRASGVRVALGHHAATREQIDAAVAAGAVLSTHLGNGAHAELPRHPNYIWDQLANDGLSASIIPDGYHLPPTVVQSFVRAKGVQRLILVSDAIALAGVQPGHYSFAGQDVVAEAGGPVRLAGTPFLVGSTLRLCDGLNNVMAFAGTAWPDVVRMATENPARLMGLEEERGFLRVGTRADLAVFRRTGAGYELAYTVAGGEVHPVAG